MRGREREEVLGQTVGKIEEDEVRHDFVRAAEAEGERFEEGERSARTFADPVHEVIARDDERAGGLHCGGGGRARAPIEE
ncbi:hypothetical protein D3C83_120420 [compost metagenome]